MKTLFSHLASALSFSFVLLSLQSQAVVTQNGQHKINLTQIHPLGIAPHTFISDKDGKAILASSDYQHYQISYDKGLTWKEIKSDGYFIPQEFSKQPNTEVYAITIKGNPLDGILDISTDSGKSWNHISRKDSNCPFYNIDQSGSFGVRTPSIVRSFQGHPMDLFFVAPTTAGKYGIFWSYDKGYNCLLTLESERGLELSVTKDGTFLYAIDKKANSVYLTPDEADWVKIPTYDLYPKGMVIKGQVQIQSPVDYSVYTDYIAYGSPAAGASPIKLLALNISYNYTNYWRSTGKALPTNLKGINFISNVKSNLFAIDAYNHFMLQDNSMKQASIRFNQLTETFDKNASVTNLSNWTFLNLDWLDQNHTQGIVNFINPAKSNEQATYQFEID